MRKRKDYSAAALRIANEFPVDESGYINNGRSEHSEQSALIQWANMQTGAYPELEYLFAVPNAGKRVGVQGKWMKAEGMKSGVPDLCLPVPRGGYHSLWIEMKTMTGRPSPEQLKWLEFLNSSGHMAALAYGFEMARDTILSYLEL